MHVEWHLQLAVGQSVDWSGPELVGKMSIFCILAHSDEQRHLHINTTYMQDHTNCMYHITTLCQFTYKI